MPDPRDSGIACSFGKNHRRLLIKNKKATQQRTLQNGTKKLLADAGYSAAKPLKTNMLMINLPDVAESADLQEAIAAYEEAGRLADAQNNPQLAAISRMNLATLLQRIPISPPEGGQ